MSWLSHPQRRLTFPRPAVPCPQSSGSLSTHTLADCCGWRKDGSFSSDGRLFQGGKRVNCLCLHSRTELRSRGRASRSSQLLSPQKCHKATQTCFLDIVWRNSGRQKVTKPPSMIWLFLQTVGHQVIHLYAEAVGLPLHRGTIKRDRSINTDLSYETTIDDEVEDLYRLLKNLLDPLEGIQYVGV